MRWVILWTIVAAAGVLGAVAAVNSLRFARLVAREVQAVAEASGAVAPLDAAVRADVPPPVQRYLGKALGRRSSAIRAARLRHGGTFRPSVTGSWLPIHGEQYFTADPPAFIWWGRVRIFPGLWIDARDRSVDGAGRMLVAAESTLTLADSSGPQLDQGALLRLLGEMMWFPTAYLDARYVHWSPIDEHRASATLRVNGREVTGVFTFGSDDLPVTFSADRYRDVGGGRAVLTPFIGRNGDYRAVDGVLVPHRVSAAWMIDGQPIEYANFEVERLEFDPSPGAR